MSGRLCGVLLLTGFLFLSLLSPVPAGQDPDPETIRLRAVRLDSGDLETFINRADTEKWIPAEYKYAGLDFVEGVEYEFIVGNTNGELFLKQIYATSSIKDFFIHDFLEIYRGHYNLRGGNGIFQACGTDRIIPVEDETAGILAKAYKTLAHPSEERIYVEFRGYSDAATGKLHIIKLINAAYEGFGCTDRFDNVYFQAAGNEPFWSVMISPDQIVFMQPDEPRKIIFPYHDPTITGNLLAYSSMTAGEKPKHIWIYISADSCFDSMSGMYNSYNATVNLDGRILTGCSKKGKLEFPRVKRFYSKCEYSKTLDLHGITAVLHVPQDESCSIGTIQTRIIFPDGGIQELKAERDGTITEAWLIDPLSDSHPYLVICTSSAGSGSYGLALMYKETEGLFRRVEEASMTKGQKKGYIGHDTFSLESGTLYRSFPIYNEGDPNARPTGGKARFRYSFEENRWETIE